MSPGSSTCFRVTQSPPVSFSQIFSASVTFTVSLALFQYFIQISVWFVLEVGPAFDRGLDSIHSRERPQLRSLLQYHHRSPRQYLRSLRGFVDTRHGWDPGPHHLYLRGELGGPGPPSGPAHRAQASHLSLGSSHHQSHLLQRRHHHLSCRLPPGSGGRCS